MLAKSPRLCDFQRVVERANRDDRDFKVGPSFMQCEQPGKKENGWLSSVKIQPVIDTKCYIPRQR